MEESVIIPFDIGEVKTDILRGINECSQRGLMHSTKWLAELNYTLREVHVDPHVMTHDVSSINSTKEDDMYILAKSYFDMKEYARASYFVQGCKTPKGRFLCYYAHYLAIEKEKLDEMHGMPPPDPLNNEKLKVLCRKMRRDHAAGQLDGFCLYLFGVTLKKLQLKQEAIEVLVEATHKQPIHWGTWQELTALIINREMLDSLTLPHHWVTNFFLAHLYLDMQLVDQALAIYRELEINGFEGNGYILAQIAIGVHYKRDIDSAIENFELIIQDDPYTLDNMDTFSNLLYVKEMRKDLSFLAQRAVEVDKFRPETCCIIGNFYSLRTDHQNAIKYLLKALKINPQYPCAWTLLGHEMMEVKNTHGAIHSYSQAVEVNRRDYRAWYGLGQTYEMIKMPHFAIYYYKQAQLLRPHDSRMVLALGDAYEKQDRNEDAIKCYHKAVAVGDVDGMALVKLATLYDSLNEIDNAAAAWEDFVTSEPQKSNDFDRYRAYKYLACYNLKRKKDLDKAFLYGQKWLQYDDTEDEAQKFLRTVAQKRFNLEENPMMIEDMNETDPVDDRSFQNDDSSDNQLSPINLSLTPTPSPIGE